MARPVCIAAAVLAALVLAAPAGGAPASCGLRGSVTLVSTPQARIFSLPVRFTYETGEYDTGKRIYGCLRSTGRRLLIAQEVYTASIGDDTRDYRVAGSVVAFQTGSRDFAGLEVRSLRTGRAFPVPGFIALPGFTEDIVLRPTGDAAWIARSPRSTLVVAKRDMDGVRRLATGADIDPRSLRLIGSRLTWTQAGVTHRATLGAPIR